MLTGTALLARGLARRLASVDAPEAEAAGEVVKHVKDADQLARRLARGLVPVELEAGGLSAALERLGASAAPLFGIDCQVRTAGEEVPLDDPTPAHLFRIAQEALSNAARHGQAGRVTVTLAYSAERLRLRIEDDGVGIAGARGPGPGEPSSSPTALRVSAPARPDDPRGMGVRIMHYRARVIGGALEIRPGPDGGTVVTCTVPLHRPLPTASDPA
jgi:signal transduction histidine kinase